MRTLLARLNRGYAGLLTRLGALIAWVYGAAFALHLLDAGVWYLFPSVFTAVLGALALAAGAASYVLNGRVHS